MLADDHVDYPMAVFMRFFFSGSVDRERMQKAFAWALAFHPLLNARVNGDVRGRTQNLHWTPHASLPRIIFCEANEDCSEFNFPTAIDLTSEPGIRLWCFNESSNPCFVIQWHHSCCDGIGIIHFIETMLLAYCDARSDSQDDPYALTRDRTWWKTRSTNHPSWFDNLRRLPFDLARISAYHFNRTLPMHSKKELQNSETSSSERKAWLSSTLTRSETEGLILLAQQNQVSVNDLLLREYFQTVYSWNRQSGGEQKCNIRIGVPIDLRSSEEVLNPAVNDVSIVFLDRNAEQIHNEKFLLQSIHDEMQGVKEKQTGRAMIRLLENSGAIKGGMLKLLNLSGTRITSVLSNYGCQFLHSELLDQEGKIVADSLVLEKIEPYPVLRAGVRIGINAITYNKRLTFTLNYDPRYFLIADSQEILNSFIQQIQNKIISNPSSDNQTMN